jgi:hypothetical protein
MIVKKTCSGLGKAITAALLILSCPTIPQDNVRNNMNNATNSIALNLIFIILIFFETQIYLFFRQIKTSTLRLRKLRNNILLCFGTKEKRTFIHNLR